MGAAVFMYVCTWTYMYIGCTTHTNYYRGFVDDDSKEQKVQIAFLEPYK